MKDNWEIRSQNKQTNNQKRTNQKKNLPENDGQGEEYSRKLLNLLLLHSITGLTRMKQLKAHPSSYLLTLWTRPRVTSNDPARFDPFPESRWKWWLASSPIESGRNHWISCPVAITLHTGLHFSRWGWGLVLLALVSSTVCPHSERYRYTHPRALWCCVTWPKRTAPSHSLSRSRCMRSNQSPFQHRRGTRELPPRAEKHRQWTATRGGRVHFLYGCGPWVVDYATVDDPTTTCV